MAKFCFMSDYLPAILCYTWLRNRPSGVVGSMPPSLIAFGFAEARIQEELCNHSFAGVGQIVQLQLCLVIAFPNLLFLGLAPW